MLARLGIGPELLPRYPRELSGGQQQRASLARAFLLRPDVLLMDEPFSALDAITREEMQEVFFSLWRAQAVTTVLVTHYVEEALYLGQTVVVLSAAPGRVAAVMENPLFARRETSGEFDEEKIFALQEQKKALIDKMIQPGESFLSKLTEAEIRALFE